MNEDATINGYSENGNALGDKSLIIMIGRKNGETGDQFKQVDAVRSVLRFHIANSTDDVQDRISELANALNRSIPSGYTNLEVAMALDALQFMILSDMIEESRPQEKVKEEASA